MQASQAGVPTSEVSFSDFFTSHGANYYGAYTLNNKTLTFTQRRSIVKTARDLVDAQIPYPPHSFDGQGTSLLYGPPYCLLYYGNTFDGSDEDISNIRCDGFVEYAYEYNGHRVWRNQNYPDSQWSIVSYPDLHNDRPDNTRNPEREASPWAQRGAPCGTGPDLFGCSYSAPDTKMNRSAVITLPTYQVTPVSGIGYVDVTIRATDESGIHYIGYRKPGDATWYYSAKQPQHPTSDSFSFAPVRITTSGTLYVFAVDNGGNFPDDATGYTITVTSVALPSVETRTVVDADIGTTTATIRGRVFSDGGSAISDRRFDWGLSTPLTQAVRSEAITVNGNDFSTTLTGLSPNTTYFFRAWARNGSSQVGSCTPVSGWGCGDILSFKTKTVPPPDMTPPTVNINSPTSGQVFSSSPITVNGMATDSGRGNSGITSVTVNGVRASNDSAAGSGTANWSRTISLATGVNTITVVATDGAGNPTSSSISVTYTPPDTIPPTVSITSPTSGQVFSSSPITVSGTATDSGHGNNGVSSVTVNGDTASGGTASGANTAHWSATITLNPGVNTITVVAKDAFNNSSQEQVTVNLPTFVNLDFEAATIPPPPVFYELPIGSALPGWTAYFDTSQLSSIWYNNRALGGVAISIHDLNPYAVLEGSYSLMLQAGLSSGFEWSSVSVAQTGFIPVGVKSLRFFVNGGGFEVKMGGQSLPYAQIAIGANYRVCGVDVSAFAGTTSELRFEVLPYLGTSFPFNDVYLDNFQFSSIPLPPIGVISTSVLPTVGGEASSGGRYAIGQIVNLSAFADMGYSFVSWTENGNVVSITNVYSFEVTGNRHLTANFVANPVLTYGPSALTIAVAQGQSATNQSFEVWNAGGGTLYYTNTVNQPWLSVSPTTGSSAGEHDSIQVSFTTATLNVGTHDALITISSPVGTQQIPVTLIVSAPALPPEVVSWGDNGYGQTDVPPQATNVAAISAGGFHNLVLKADGTVLAWGRDTFGQVKVPAAAVNVVALSAGFFHNLALKADRSVFGWGERTLGQTNVPPEATDVVALAAGGNFNLALRADGRVVSWGESNFGKTNVPPHATNMVAIAAGTDHSLALRMDGKVVSWGWNVSGQTSVPSSATNVVAIAAGA
ncbi:MAG: hypothetical protein IH623_02375, partial [Verrucomicrobia bacterium]|nr:hypothetical protein [Verrucomicrobiota bacterium]